MWVEPLPNGKYKFVERYTDFVTGRIKKISVTLDRNTTQSRKVAERTLQEKIKARLEIRDNSITLGELFEYYKEEKRRTLKPSTYSSTTSTIGCTVRIIGEDIRLDQLNARYVNRKLLQCQDKTIHTKERKFKELIRWGYKRDFIRDISFLDKLQEFKTVHKNPDEKYLESEEVSKLLESIKLPVWNMLTRFLVTSGMRIGEVIALNSDDVDMENRIITINKNYDYKNCIVTTAKTECSNREIYIQDELFRICMEIKDYLFKDMLRMGYRTELFIHNHGHRISYNAYIRYLNRHGIESIGRVVSPHMLRHTHVSLLSEQGIPIDTISHRLGHETSDVTKSIYLHVTEKKKQAEREQIKEIKLL